MAQPRSGVRVFGVDPSDARTDRDAEFAELAQQGLRRFLDRESMNGVEFDLQPRCPNLWKSETELAIFDGELQNPRRMAFAEVCLMPVDWIRLQIAQGTAGVTDDNSVETWLSRFDPDAGGSSNVGVFVEKLQGDLPTDIPIPALRIGRNGGATSFQEGRTRGVAAYLAGLDTMNCLIAADSTRSGVDDALPVPSRFEVRQFLDEFTDQYATRSAFTPEDDPTDRWQRLMAESRNQIEELGITGPLPERDGEA